MHSPPCKEQYIILFLVTTEEKGGEKEAYKEQNDEEANLSSLEMLEREREQRGGVMGISVCGQVPTVGWFKMRL